MLKKQHRIRSGWESLLNVKIRVVDRTKIRYHRLSGMSRGCFPDLQVQRKTSNLFGILKQSLHVWHTLTKVRWGGLPPSPGGYNPGDLVIHSTFEQEGSIPLSTDWMSAICCWRSRVKQQALTLFKVLPSSIQESWFARQTWTEETIQVNKFLYNKVSLLPGGVWCRVATMREPPPDHQHQLAIKGVNRKDTRNFTVCVGNSGGRSMEWREWLIPLGSRREKKN